MSYPQPKLPSSALLISRHSTAKVIVSLPRASDFPGQYRPMNRQDALAQMIKQYG